MSNPIPIFDHNLVLPPHLGNPTKRDQVSPYKCTTYDICERFGTSKERIEILKGFLGFRSKLTANNLLNGFQWLDGSFLEDVETREKRPPNDLDLVTIYWGYDIPFQLKLYSNFPEFADARMAKANFKLDHYPFDASTNPDRVVQTSRYWTQLFSHNRDSVWKGMLQVDLNTGALDKQALDFLNTIVK